MLLLQSWYFSINPPYLFQVWHSLALGCWRWGTRGDFWSWWCSMPSSCFVFSNQEGSLLMWRGRRGKPNQTIEFSIFDNQATVLSLRSPSGSGVEKKEENVGLVAKRETELSLLPTSSLPTTPFAGVIHLILDPDPHSRSKIAHISQTSCIKTHCLFSFTYPQSSRPSSGMTEHKYV